MAQYPTPMPSQGDWYARMMAAKSIDMAAKEAAKANSVTIDFNRAEQAIRDAQDAVSVLPAGYRIMFESDLRRLDNMLQGCRDMHAVGEQHHGDAGHHYGSALQYWGSGNYRGAEDSAIKATAQYIMAFSAYSSAGSGLGNVVSVARDIVRRADSLVQ